MRTSNRQRIFSEIAEAEKQLASLRDQQQKVESTIQLLKQNLEHDDGEHSGDSDISLPNSTGSLSSFRPEEKIILFRHLFRGRENVYPKLWINKKTGKKGYSPACSNEWVRGVCEKPRVKCGDCPNQAFLPVTNDTVLGHLQGRHVIGIYPMLQNETCWFLAADFDKEAWRDDVRVIVKCGV